MRTKFEQVAEFTSKSFDERQKLENDLFFPLHYIEYSTE